MKSYQEFVHDLGDRESSGSYTVVNHLGFLGRYQFGLARLADFGLARRKPRTRGPENSAFTWAPPFSEVLFLGSPALQDQCFDVHVGRYRRWIAEKYTPVLGRLFSGVPLTMSSAVAICHLLGPGGLMSFLKGIDIADANHVTAGAYARGFSGYDVPDALPTEVTWRPMVPDLAAV